jgi:hypothetical protein
MPITLAQAMINANSDVDYAVIETFRRYDNTLLDLMVWDDIVTPGTGEATLSYTYTRLSAAAAAGPRQFNSEYIPGKATRTRQSVDLKPYGGSYELDRVFANLGPRTTQEVAFQTQQLMKSTRVAWSTDLIRGDSSVNAAQFDGLSKILTGSVTEVNSTTLDITPATITTQAAAMAAYDRLSLWLSSILPSAIGSGDQTPGAVPPGELAILGNTLAINRLEALARWAGLYTTNGDPLGRKVKYLGEWRLIDIGDTYDGSGPIIPTGASVAGETDIYAVSFGIDGLHGVTMAGRELVKVYLPDFTTAGAVKLGEVEFGPAAPVLKSTKTAGVFRKVKVSA